MILQHGTKLKQKYVLHTFWYVFPPYTVHTIFRYVMQYYYNFYEMQT